MNSKISGAQLLTLKDTVVLNFTASNWLELGALTNLISEVERHSRLLRSLSFGDEDYDGNALMFLRKMIGPEDENLELVTSYIECKFGKPGENISSTEISGRRQIVFSPSIFDVPAQPVEHDLVAVMMPFDNSMSLVYDAIKHAASENQLNCNRADDIWDHSTVIQDVFSLIFRSHIVICDLTGKNPNVFYEAGIAHTLGKHVIPITQSKADIPFDLSHHRYILYLNNAEGRAKLSSELSSRLSSLTRSTNASPW